MLEKIKVDFQLSKNTSSNKLKFKLGLDADDILESDIDSNY